MEVGEAIKAAAAIATFASVSDEVATGVPQRTSHWWHPSAYLEGGRCDRTTDVGRTSSCASGERKGANAETSFKN